MNATEGTAGQAEATMTESPAPDAQVSSAAQTATVLPGLEQPETLAIVGLSNSDGANSDGSNSDTIVIWHVELAPQLSGDRLSGAWLIDASTDDALDRVRNLVANCSVYLLEGADVGVVKQAMAEAEVAQVDLVASVAAVREHIDELKEQVKAEKQKPGREKLTEPRFPRIDDFEAIEFAHVGEKAAGAVLAAARGVEKLIAQWGELEGVRRRREYLREPWGKESRQLPLTTAR